MFVPCLALIIFVIGKVSSQSEVCNPIECFNHLNSLFELKDSDDPYLKILRLEKCVTLCSPSKAQNVLVEGLKSVKLDISEDINSRALNNKCENKHKFALFACLYESLTLEPVDPTVNESFVLCRQASEGERCDIKVLPHCTAHAHYLSGVLLESFFKPLRRNHCFFSMQDVYDLNMKPAALMTDLQDLAECFDRNNHYVTECIPHKWVTPNFLIGAHFGKKLCRATQDFLDCMQGVVHSKCSAVETTFTRISQDLYRYIMPHCVEKIENPLPLKTLDGSNEVLDDATAPHSLNDTDVVTLESAKKVAENLPSSTPLPLNSSGTAVVHQNVFISVNYNDLVFSGACVINTYSAYLAMAISLQILYLNFNNRLF